MQCWMKQQNVRFVSTAARSTLCAADTRVVSSLSVVHEDYEPSSENREGSCELWAVSVCVCDSIFCVDFSFGWIISHKFTMWTRFIFSCWFWFHLIDSVEFGATKWNRHSERNGTFLNGQSSPAFGFGLNCYRALATLEKVVRFKGLRSHSVRRRLVPSVRICFRNSCFAYQAKAFF